MAQSGRTVVLAILAALLAVVGIVVAGFLLFEPEKAPCATGEAAENEFIDGAYVPRQETFESVEDAEAFICHDVPILHTEGWELETISAERSHELSQTVDGNGYAGVTLTYENAALGKTLVLDATPFQFREDIPQPSTEKEVRFGEYRGRLIRGGINPSSALLFWTVGNLQMRATTQTDTSFTEQELLEVLATAR